MDAITHEQLQATLAHLLERKRSYQQGCGSEMTALMMQDLARFCRAETSCFHEDPRIHAVLEGRREVWIRIQEHLTKTPEELLNIYCAAVVKVRE